MRVVRYIVSSLTIVRCRSLEIAARMASCPETMKLFREMPARPTTISCADGLVVEAVKRFHNIRMSSIANMHARDGKRAVPASADGTSSRIQVLYRPLSQRLTIGCGLRSVSGTWI